MSLFPFLPSAAYGVDASFVFNNKRALSGWRFEHVEKARFAEGGLLLIGEKYMKIAPPTGFRAPLRRMAMELSFKTPKSLICNVLVKSADGRKARKSVKVKILEGGDEERHLRVYLGKAVAGTYIDDFVVEFYGPDKLEVSLDSLRLYEPTTAGIASMLWDEFWRTGFVSIDLMVNVPSPKADGLGFISMLYILIALAFITAIAIYMVRGHGLSLRKSLGVLVIIFLVAGVLFTLRMDYKWLVMFRDDVKTLPGADVGKRIRLVNNRHYDSFFDFLDFVKRSVPAGSAVRPATIAKTQPLAAIARYYLLPVDTSENGGFLWSQGEARLDPESGALYDGKGRLIAPRVRLFARYSGNGAIYEVIK